MKTDEQLLVGDSEMYRAMYEEEKYQNTLLAQKCSDIADELNESKGLANALLDDYHDLIRICTAIYKWRKESVKEMINQSTGGNDFEKFKNHLGV